MKKLDQKTARAKSGRRRSRQEIGTTAGCAIFLMGGGVAMAQDQAAGANENIDEVVVTGLRKSIQDSIGVK